MNDVESFALAFGIVWFALALYLAWLHRAADRVRARVEALERRGR